MTFSALVRRILRLRCPACGRGRLFSRYFVRTERCGHCRWKFERGEGHWVGGSEVHMFASYGLSVILCIPFLVVLGPTTAVMTGIIAAHVIVSLTVFRYSRAIFLGVDYFLDPTPPERDDDDRDDFSEPARPRTPPTMGRRRARRREPGSMRDRHSPVGR